MAKRASRAGVSLRQILFMAALAASCAPASAQTSPSQPSSSQPSSSQSWTERPYNPPLGSRWSIVSVSNAEEMRPPNGNRNQQIRTSTELTIEEKIADGFRISYVTRDIQISGNAPGTEIAQTAFGAIKGIVVRARTDAAGKPIAVENIDEVKGVLKTVIDRIVDTMKGNPQVAALIRQMLEGILVADEKTAAQALMEDAVALSAGQGTGLKPGAVKREADAVPSPIGGGALKSTLLTQLTQWDDKAGTARITRRREMDSESLRAVVIEVARKLSAAASDKVTPDVIEMIKKVSMEINATTLIDTRDGMTTNIEENSTTMASVAGVTFHKVERKLVSVVPMPK